jgi:rhomboid protease GluP
MAGGISPNKIVIIPLEDYNADHYLTLLYHAMLNMGWHIGYFDHDGIIAYTNISWASYSEEVSARIKANTVTIKSECVGFQGLLTDYGKNKKNLDLLLGEITYAEFHLQQHLEQTTQELMNEVPEKQFLSLDDPPMAGKEQLRGFFSPVVPRKKYFITPILVIVNILIFIISRVLFNVLPLFLSRRQFHLSPGESVQEKIYMWLGFNNRNHVLGGEVWRLVTSIFQHFTFFHLFFNMIALVYIGSLIECKLGKWNYLLMFLFTGIIASMVSVFWNYSQISAGASGAIFGLFGILLALLSTNFYERSARKALLISTAIVVAFNIIPVGEGVDHSAHFGGLISGYVFGWIAYAGLNHQNRLIKKWGIAVSGTFIVTAFVLFGVLFSTQYQVKEYDQLLEKTQTIITDLNKDFYGNGDVGGDARGRAEKLVTIEGMALPEVEKLRKISPELRNLKLPAKNEKTARATAMLIDLQCQYYPLLYREFKEQNYALYRPKIDSITTLINKVRGDYFRNN